VRKNTTAMAAAIFAFTALAFSARADENDVSPLLAKKAVKYCQLKYHPEEFAEGRELQISEPKVYYDYGREKKYYVIYTYSGPGEIPGWGALPKKDAEKLDPYFRTFMVPADKRDCFFFTGRGGMPVVVHYIGQAKLGLERLNPNNKYEFVRAVICAGEVFYVFEENAKREVIVNLGGGIIREEELPMIGYSDIPVEIWGDLE